MLFVQRTWEKASNLRFPLSDCQFVKDDWLGRKPQLAGQPVTSLFYELKKCAPIRWGPRSSDGHVVAAAGVKLWRSLRIGRCFLQLIANLTHGVRHGGCEQLGEIGFAVARNCRRPQKVLLSCLSSLMSCRAKVCAHSILNTTSIFQKQIHTCGSLQDV